MAHKQHRIIKTREEALIEFIVIEQRLFEYIHIHLLAIKLAEDESFCPENDLGHTSHHFRLTLKTMRTGIFYSLIDSTESAANLFAVWRFLFPEERQRIDAVWDTIKTGYQDLQHYRNNVAFHVNKSLGTYLKYRYKNPEKIDGMINEFDQLLIYLLKKMPNFGIEARVILKRELPAATDEQIDQAMQYFLLT